MNALTNIAQIADADMNSFIPAMVEATGRAVYIIEEITDFEFDDSEDGLAEITLCAVAPANSIYARKGLSTAVIDSRKLVRLA